MDTQKEKVFCTEYDLNQQGWLLAYMFLTKKERLIKKVPQSNIYLLAKKSVETKTNMDYAKVSTRS
jgi:hypothetical protein